MSKRTRPETWDEDGKQDYQVYKKSRQDELPLPVLHQSESKKRPREESKNNKEQDDACPRHKRSRLETKKRKRDDDEEGEEEPPHKKSFRIDQRLLDYMEYLTGHPWTSQIEDFKERVAVYLRYICQNQYLKTVHTENLQHREIQVF